MIVCKQCGYQNEEGDTFCGSCGAFLEWVGEKVGGEEPAAEPEPEVAAAATADEKAGLMTRIKHAITGDEAAGAGETPADAGTEPAEAAPTASAPAAAAAAAAATPAATAATAAPPVTEAPTAVSATVVAADVPAATLAPPVAAGAPAAAGAPPAGTGGAPLAPPPGPHGSLPPPPPGSAADTEKAKKAEAEARKQAEEEEARKRDEEARRKAALLVAKPKEPAVEAKPATGVAPTATPAGKGKKGSAAPAAAAAAAGAAAAGAAAAASIEARQPGAQQPGAAVQRPKVQKQAPSRAVKPGDLVCGECGEGNDATRKFCRRCGASLAEVVPVKQPGFFKRLFTRKPKEAAPAGTRPGRAGGGGGGTGRPGEKARLAKGKALGSFDKARGLLGILALAGVAGVMIIPSGRSFVMRPVHAVTDWFHQLTGPLKDALPDQDKTKFTSQTEPDGLGKYAVDNITNNHWLPLANDPGPAVAAVWNDPVTLRKLRIFSGNQDQPQNFAANPRPKDIFFQVYDDKGNVIGTKQVRLEDSAKQTINFKFKNVTSVRAEVQDCYNAPPTAPKQCAITELNFLK